MDGEPCSRAEAGCELAHTRGKRGTCEERKRYRPSPDGGKAESTYLACVPDPNARACGCVSAGGTGGFLIVLALPALLRRRW